MRAPCSTCQSCIAEWRVGSSVRADFVPGERAERHRRVRRAERRRADLRNRHAELGGQQREADDVAGLALVGAHAERRVALQMLDRAVAFARRERDVGDGHVVLQIDEALGARGATAPTTALAARPVDSAARGRRRHCAVRARKPDRAAAARPAACPSASTAREVELAVGRAGGDDRLRRGVGHERRQRVVVAQLAARLRVEMHRGIPAARHADQIAVDRGVPRRLRARCADRRRRRAACRARATIAPPASIGMPAARARCGWSPTSVGFRPRIDDRGDVDARVVQAQRRCRRRCRCW